MEAFSLNNDDWHKFVYIFTQFNDDLTKYKKDKDLEKYLWNKLINIQLKWREDIEQAIRYNSKLCYMLDKQDEVKKINQPLFKLHNLFDRNFYLNNEDPSPGLKKFLKMIEKIFSDLKEFKKVLHLSRAMINFIKRRNDQVLIDHYNYIKDISLPLKGYDRLRMALLAVIKKYEHLSTLLTIPAAFNEFLADFEKFKNLYVKKYISAHSQFQKKVEGFIYKLHNLQEYRALQLLSNIEVVEVTYGLKPIKKYIDNFFPQHCGHDNLEEILKDKPRCECNFNFNESVMIPPLTKITPMLKKGIREYIKQLTNKKYFRKKLLQYSQNNKETPIKKFLEVEQDINKAIQLINKNLVDDINKALSCTYSINIKLSDLYSELKGSYSAENLDEFNNNMQIGLEKIINKRKKEIGNPDPSQIIFHLVK